MPNSKLSPTSIDGYAHGQVPREVRERQIIKVSLNLFAELGYEATSISAVAAQAGVTRPIIYSHFGSKEGLYLACLSEARRELHVALNHTVGRQDEPTARLKIGFDAYFGFVERHGRQWDVLVGGGAAVSGNMASVAMKIRLDTIELIAKFIEDALPNTEQVEIETMAHFYAGACEQLVRWWRAHPEVEKSEIVERMVRLSWAGSRVMLVRDKSLEK